MLLQSSFCCQEEENLTKGEGEEELEYAYILNTGTKINTRGYRVSFSFCLRKLEFIFNAVIIVDDQ